jgi:hypothetical protein
MVVPVFGRITPAVGVTGDQELFGSLNTGTPGSDGWLWKNSAAVLKPM